MRLVDADMLLDRVEWANTNWLIDHGETAVALIKAAPTIEERKTGRWLELTNTNHSYICSVCGRMLVNITDGKNTVTKNYPFCHCGADMRERQEE